RREDANLLMALQLDITARKLAEKKLQEDQRHRDFQLALGDQLRRLELPEHIETTVCEALGLHLGLLDVQLLEVDITNESWRSIAHWSACQRMPGILPMDTEHLYEAVRGQRVVPFLAIDMSTDAGLIVPLAHCG